MKVPWLAWGPLIKIAVGGRIESVILNEEFE
jgi:hypothetical protein